MDYKEHAQQNLVVKFCSYITMSKKSYQFKYVFLIKIKVRDIT